MLTHEHKVFCIGRTGVFGEALRYYDLETVISEIDADPKWDGWEVLAVLQANFHEGVTLVMRRERSIASTFQLGPLPARTDALP